MLSDALSPTAAPLPMQQGAEDRSFLIVSVRVPGGKCSAGIRWQAPNRPSWHRICNMVRRSTAPSAQAALIERVPCMSEPSPAQPLLPQSRTRSTRLNVEHEILGQHALHPEHQRPIHSMKVGNTIFLHDV